MNILPVTNQTNYMTFASKGAALKQITRPVNSNIVKQTSCIAGAGVIMSTIDDLLKQNDITYCKSGNYLINVCSGNNHGFYTIKTGTDFSTSEAKEYLRRVLSDGDPLAGGFTNYLTLVKDLKRQDIIQKGLKIHTYELNSNISDTHAKEAAKKIGKYLKKNINPKNLFYIEEDAFYYDAQTKSAYGVNMTAKLSYLSDDVILKCKFITNDKGEAVGFDCNHFDSYKSGTINTHYIEQQTKSSDLKPIADSDNNKEYAEAFRFGNAEINYRIKDVLPAVINHLTQRAGIKNLTEKDIQIAKFYDKNKNIVTRICYYDSATGKSFVYSPEGKYMYRLEYNKDPNGNIYACNRL